MGAPGMTSPIRSGGYENLQLNAGVFLANVDLSVIYDAAQLRALVADKIAAGEHLGMTSGGGTFTVKRDTRKAEADGRRFEFVGGVFVDAMDASITGNLLETTYGNFCKLIGTVDADLSRSAWTVPAGTAGGSYYDMATGQWITVPPGQSFPTVTTKGGTKIGTALTDGSYLDNIVWIGDVADGGLCAIVLDNALNTADISLTFQDKAEGKLPFELHAHQANVKLYVTAPVTVNFFEGELTTLQIADTTMQTTMTPSGKMTMSTPYPTTGIYQFSFKTTSSDENMALVQPYMRFNTDSETSHFEKHNGRWYAVFTAWQSITSLGFSGNFFASGAEDIPMTDILLIRIGDYE